MFAGCKREALCCDFFGCLLKTGSKKPSMPVSAKGPGKSLVGLMEGLMEDLAGLWAEVQQRHSVV